MAIDPEKAARGAQAAISRMRGALKVWAERIRDFDQELADRHREISDALEDRTPVARTRSQLLAEAKKSASQATDILDRASQELEQSHRRNSRPPRRGP